MSGRCDQCRKRLTGEGHHTATRVLCDDCYTQFAGLTVGYMADGTVGDAISTAGWYERVKKAINRKD
ncbi:hypothetical protein ABH923_000285 [Leifsonia sp. EB41]